MAADVTADEMRAIRHRARRRCKQIVRNGQRCTRIAAKNGACWQHQGICGWQWSKR